MLLTWWEQAKQADHLEIGLLVMETGNKELAATYSRGSYTTTTIGNAVFDGRVRDGIGSDHCFMATNKMLKELLAVL